MRKTVSTLAWLGMLAAAPLFAQDLKSFEKNVTVRTLANSLTVIYVQRPEAPVFSYATVVNAGNAQEVPGITGLAHMFEHMAFKGSETVGTTNYEAERAALQKVESAYNAYEVEREKTVGHDDAKVAQLEKAWKDALDDARHHTHVFCEATSIGIKARGYADFLVFRALGKQLSLAVEAIAARYMVKTDHPISNLPWLNSGSNLLHRTRDLVTENLRRANKAMTDLLHVRSADAACSNADQDFAF